MQSPGNVGATTDPVARFKAIACVIENKFGTHTDLVEAQKIYEELIMIRQKLKMLDDWLKTDADNFEAF